MWIIYGKPNCPYCEKAKNYLDNLGEKYEYKDVSASDLLREEMQEMVRDFGWGGPARTVPQIFCGTDYIGGFDSLDKYMKPATLDDLSDISFDL